MKNEIIVDGVTYVKKEETKAEVKKVNITIRNRFTGEIIYESEKTTYRDAINEMVAEAKKTGTRADLTDANLAYANLTRANLTDANLAYANLTDADLTRADLTGANLTDADLTRANLTACTYYMGSSNKNFEALCKAIKTIKWNDKTGADFIK